MKITSQSNIFLTLELSNPVKILNSISNGITITDINSKIIYINKAFSTITGYSPEDVLGKKPGILHSGHHDRNFYEDMWKSISEQGFWEGEIWNRKKSGIAYPEILTISKIKMGTSNEDCYAGVFSDITFLKKDVSKTMHLAFYDALTELPNRNLYNDRANHSIESARDHSGKIVAFLYMDLDKFKPVNDTYGHCTGDALLKSVGSRIASVMRSGDTAARVGGDEFNVILNSIKDTKDAIQVANRIVDTVEKPYSIDGHNIQISISIGISFFPNNATSFAELAKQSDEAMYAAKKKKAKVMTYNDIS